MVNKTDNSTKGKLLTILRSKQGTPCSGTKLAHALGLSRVAIWKALHELITAGYPIRAEKTGYTYESQHEDFLLPAEFGSREAYITYADTVSSTMDMALKYAVQGAPDGSVFIAEHQTQGRGRKSRGWVSLRGNLLFTLLIRPKAPFYATYTLIRTAQLALAMILQDICPRAEIFAKWPNDILINRKKAAGILAEGMIASDELSWLSLGIGINVKHKTDDPHTTCLSEACTALPPRAGILTRFLDTFTKAKTQPEFLTAFEKDHALWKKKNLICLLTLPDGTIKKGCIKKVDNLGQLHFLPLDNRERTLAVSASEASLEYYEYHD